MAKLLVLIDYQSCFLSHTILTGLHELMEHEIWEMPVLNSVRGGVDKDYILPDGKTGYTGTPGYLSTPLPAYDREGDPLDMIYDFELIIMLSGRDYARRGLKAILDRTGKQPGDLPLILCEGEDYGFVDRDFLSHYNPRVFFKRELSKQYSLAAYSGAYGRPIWPLQFGAFTRSMPNPGPATGDICDFFLSLGDTHELRRRLVRGLLDSPPPGKNMYVACNAEESAIKDHPLRKPMMGWPEYMTAQAQARMTAVVRGFGKDTLHCWEAFASPTFVFFFEPDLHIPYPFVDGVHCKILREDQVDNLSAEIARMDMAEATECGVRGNWHCLTHHTTKERARYLIDVATREIYGAKRPQPQEFGL